MTDQWMRHKSNNLKDATVTFGVVTECDCRDCTALADNPKATGVFTVIFTQYGARLHTLTSKLTPCDEPPPLPEGVCHACAERMVFYSGDWTHYGDRDEHVPVLVREEFPPSTPVEWPKNSNRWWFRSPDFTAYESLEATPNWMDWKDMAGARRAMPAPILSDGYDAYDE